MLNELNRQLIPTASAEAVPDPARNQPIEEPDEPDEAASGPAPMVARDHADTAMLLRELSSLGLSDDDDRPSPAPPRSPRSSPPASAANNKDKKRKGLFGRG
jgi:hypothetical protein